MAGQTYCAAAGHRDRLRPCAAGHLCPVAVRHRHRPQGGLELCPTRGGNAMSHRLDLPGLHPPGPHGLGPHLPGPHLPGPHLAGLSLSTTPGAPTTVLAGLMSPTIPLFDSVWFQALVVFVALNTLFYAMLAVRNLIPKRRV